MLERLDLQSFPNRASPELHSGHQYSTVYVPSVRSDDWPPGDALGRERRQWERLGCSSGNCKKLLFCNFLTAGRDAVSCDWCLSVLFIYSRYTHSGAPAGKPLAVSSFLWLAGVWKDVSVNVPQIFTQFLKGEHR
ncbi:hypothetical protein NN561_011328 [Cricetulus griseus]